MTFEEQIADIRKSHDAAMEEGLDYDYISVKRPIHPETREYCKKHFIPIRMKPIPRVSIKVSELEELRAKANKT
jgi:hypothetical protein